MASDRSSGYYASMFFIRRYLIARENNESAAPVAFAHFRYDMDYDDEVVYVYEIQGRMAYINAYGRLHK